MLYHKCKCGLLIPIDKKLCSDCYKKRSNKYSKTYKIRRTDIKEQKFYVSKLWFRVRDKIRNRDNKLCLMCLAEHRITKVECIHHIIELKEDWNLRFNNNNLISLCKEHHSKVHRAYEEDDRTKLDTQNYLRELIDNKFK